MKITLKWLLPAVCLWVGVSTGVKAAEPAAEARPQCDTAECGSVPPSVQVTDAEGNRYRLVPLRSRRVTDTEGNSYRFLQSAMPTVVGEDGRTYRLALLGGELEPRHALSVEIGALVNGINRRVGCADSPVDWLMPGEYPGERRYYQGPLRTSGAIGIMYGYRVKRWLEVGATLTYAGFWRDMYFSADDRVFAHQREHYVSVMPYVRFSWLNRPIVRLYSGLHLGYQWSRERYFLSEYANYNYFAGHLTLVGVSVGRRVFGYAEFGVGMRGMAVVGIGYRFGETSNK